MVRGRGWHVWRAGGGLQPHLQKDKPAINLSLIPDIPGNKQPKGGSSSHKIFLSWIRCEPLRNHPHQPVTQQAASSLSYYYCTTTVDSGVVLTQIFRAGSDNWLHLSTCQVPTRHGQSVSVPYLWLLLYSSLFSYIEHENGYVSEAKRTVISVVSPH